VKSRIRALREANGWSQSELALRLDVSRQTINALEAGRWDPSLPLAFAVADLFNMSIEEIFEYNRAAARRR
jgi:putative transcriptional regulator